MSTLFETVVTVRLRKLGMEMSYEMNKLLAATYLSCAKYLPI